MRLLVFVKNFRGGIFLKIIEKNPPEFPLLGSVFKYNKTENPFIFANGTQCTQNIWYGDTMLKYDMTYNRFPSSRKAKCFNRIFLLMQLLN